MRISIAMATYNGSKYLQEQLNSFVTQARKPDELVVCDDGSSDDTLKILEAFSNICPFHVQIYKNDENLGYTKNFEKAIALCSGDIVLISDQDDVWLESKIAVIESLFYSDSRVMVIINDQEITDENLTTTNLTVMSKSKSLGFSESWLSAGCCTAIRATFIPMLMPFPKYEIAYDGWIHMVAMSLKVRKVFPCVLQKYRRHTSATTDTMAGSVDRPSLFTPIAKYGLADVSLGWTKEIELSSYLQMHLARQFSKCDSLGIENELIDAITYEKNRCEALIERINILKKNRVYRIFYLYGFYLNGGYKYFLGWRSLIKDMIRPAVNGIS